MPNALLLDCVGVGVRCVCVSRARLSCWWLQFTERIAGPYAGEMSLCYGWSWKFSGDIM